jgi:hypothetical protein
MPAFVELITKEKLLVDQGAKSDFTQKLADVDKRRDLAIRGFHAGVKSYLIHFDPAVKDAAVSLENRIQAFREAIAQKAYLEETTAVEVFLDDMEGKFADRVTKLGLTSWVEELGNTHGDFLDLFNQRNIEYSERPKEPLRNIRTRIDAVYHQMIEVIEATIVVNGEKGYTEFINQLNAQITYFNEHEHHHKQYDLKKAVVPPIPDQVYAGIPITVLPEVFYEEKQLVFEEDFEVTYKNNHKPGLALIEVRGKGEYKGKITAGFNIVETK